MGEEPAHFLNMMDGNFITLQAGIIIIFAVINIVIIITVINIIIIIIVNINPQWDVMGRDKKEKERKTFGRIPTNQPSVQKLSILC